MLRPLICLLVIYNHVPSEGFEHFPSAIQKGLTLLLTIAVPCFVIMSFFLTSPAYIADHRIEYTQFKKRLQRLIKPFIAWSIMGFLVYPKEISPLNFLLQIFFGSVVNAPLYYMSILIYITLLFSASTIIRPNFRLTILFILASGCIVFQYTGYNFEIFNRFNESYKHTLGRIFELLPYAVAGVLIRRFYNIGKNNKDDYKPGLIPIMSVLCILGIGSVIWWCQAVRGFGYQGFGLILCSCAVFMLFLLQSNRTILRFTPQIMVSISTVSLGIYCCHYLIDRIIRSWFGHSSAYKLLGTIPFLYGLLIFTLSVLLCLKLSKAYNGRLTKYVS